MERDHAKEKQKLVKDKDAGGAVSGCPFTTLTYPLSMV